MGQGIIASFKSHYLRYFVQHGLLKAMEAGRGFNWTVLDAIYSVKATCMGQSHTSHHQELFQPLWLCAHYPCHCT